MLIGFTQQQSGKLLFIVHAIRSRLLSLRLCFSGRLSDDTAMSRFGKCCMERNSSVFVRACGGVTFLSPNKKVTKEVGLGGGAECRTPDAKAVNYGILATGKYWYYRFAARSTTLPLRTLSRRASFRVRRFFPVGFCLNYLISFILYLHLTDINF